jgi:hypothetical protein
MKIFSKLILIFLAGLSFIEAQSVKNQFIFPAKNSNSTVFSNDTLRILAVMVEFKEDKYDATIGTGKFDSHFSSNYNDTIIDPLPHNAVYFENHLEFAQNYFKKVSNGKLNIRYTTLPDVITVSKMMREYCPPYQSQDFTLLGTLSKEAWALAYQKYSNSVNFNNYDLFVIFHAGVSNSLNTGSYEVNRNLPAIYLGEKTLTKIYGSGFKGLINDGSNNLIKNSIIMPETESREQTSVDGSVSLLQISINGELVSNIASFLGLPDLYNTETGMSAIGRFGLMDGQAMVANLGIFPPEPSAWEKVYLGWETPVTTNLEKLKATITTRRNLSGSDTTLLKIPINDYEYFLIENRQQDALKDGIKLTYKKGNQTFTDLLSTENGYFYFYDKNIKGGVVVNVDEFDAAVPGNGIVIWHIDEKVINEKIASGGINNDKLRKGVAVVEADGINDIGEIITTVFGDNIGEGLTEDFFFLGNQSKYYKNRFADDTKPSAKANNGANSYIIMENFTASDAKMSFNLSYGGAIKQQYASHQDWQQSPSSLISVKEGNDLFCYLLIGNNLWRRSAFSSTANIYASFSNLKPTYFSYSDSNYIAGAYANKLNIFNISSNRFNRVTTTSSITAPPVLCPNNDAAPVLLAGYENGELVRVNLSGTAAATGIKLNSKIIKINCASNYLSAFSEYEFSDNPGVVVPVPYKIKAAALTKDINGAFVNIALTEGNRFYIIKNDVVTTEFRITNSYEIQDFILADIENNGENDIVFTAGGNLYAVTQKGNVVDNYPLSLPSGTSFLPDVLSFNYDSDKSADFVTYTSEGDIYFVNGKTGKIIKELSVSTGSKVILSNLTPIINSTSENLALTLITENNTIYTWDLLLSADKKIWYSSYSDNSNSSYLPQAVRNTVSDILLPSSRTYNWPNPVYGTSTNIRFYVNEDSQVKIKVFDMGGMLVAEFQKDASGSCDSEVVWNVSGITSGVYFARVEAVAKNSGKTEYKIIKIAVIK